MHDLLLVHVGHPVAHLVHDVDLLRQAELAVADHVGQIPSLEQLHRHEEVPLVFTVVVHLDDVGVIQLCCGLGLAAEARDPLLFGGHVRRQNLDRHDAAELRVLAAVDDTHRTLADLFDQLEAAKLLESHRADTPEMCG